ncbi:hypothetical protein WNY61_09320 [Sulfitobacter sp. AS92]|uniref:hypothetical protein n=1 Tax=Sulfitobacter sp. AS92 TaxID=3135783 RepID=UPI00316B831C
MAESYEPETVYRVRFSAPVLTPGTDVPLLPRHVHKIKGAVLAKLVEDGANVRTAEPQ